MKPTIASLVIALDNGVQCAAALRPGMKFLGAMEEASKVYAKESPEWHAFISGFISNLTHVHTDVDGNII